MAHKRGIVGFSGDLDTLAAKLSAPGLLRSRKAVSRTMPTLRVAAETERVTASAERKRA